MAGPRGTNDTLAFVLLTQSRRPREGVLASLAVHGRIKAFFLLRNFRTWLTETWGSQSEFILCLARGNPGTCRLDTL